jgi:hypothetical protein
MAELFLVKKKRKKKKNDLTSLAPIFGFFFSLHTPDTLDDVMTVTLCQTFTTIAWNY